MQALDLTGEAYHHTAGDVATLKELASMLPRNPVIINIGFCFGTSVLAMAEARKDAFIFAIDHVYCERGVENLRVAGVWDEGRVFHIVRRSQGVVWPWLVDMVFVDGGHGLADVRGDIEAWRSSLMVGGIMAFHDYGTPSLPSVRAVVDEMMDGYDVLLHRETIKAFRVFHNEVLRA